MCILLRRLCPRPHRWLVGFLWVVCGMVLVGAAEGVDGSVVVEEEHGLGEEEGRRRSRAHELNGSGGSKCRWRLGGYSCSG